VAIQLAVSLAVLSDKKRCSFAGPDDIYLINELFLFRFNDSAAPTVRERHRVEEYEEALRRNLANRRVAGVHVLTETVADYEYVATLKQLLDPCNKLRVFHLGHRPVYADFGRHASQHLLGRVCCIHHADVALGRGWEQLRLETLRGAVYALSRHEYPDSVHVAKSKCIPAYAGSHDAFVFVSPLPEAAVEKMQFVQNVWGSENTVIRILQLHDIPVINPCLALRIMHHHKTSVHNGQNSSRISWSGSVGFAEPTSSLEVEDGQGFQFSQRPGTVPQGKHRPSAKFKWKVGQPGDREPAEPY